MTKPVDLPRLRAAARRENRSEVRFATLLLRAMKGKPTLTLRDVVNLSRPHPYRPPAGVAVQWQTIDLMRAAVDVRVSVDNLGPRELDELVAWVWSLCDSDRW